MKLLLSILFCAMSLYAQDIYWYAGDRLNLIEQTGGAGYFRQLCSEVRGAGCRGIVAVDQWSKGQTVGDRWADTLEAVLSYYDSTDFQFVLTTRNTSKWPYGSPAPVPTKKCANYQRTISKSALLKSVGDRLFADVSLPSEYSRRLFDLVILTTGRTNVYVHRKVAGEPQLYKFTNLPAGEQKLLFHSLENSTPYQITVLAIDPNTSVYIQKLTEREPLSTEAKWDSSGKWYDYNAVRCPANPEDLDVVWNACKPSLDMWKLFGHHKCVTALWHSTDEVGFYGYQNFKHFKSGGDAYIYWLSTGVKFDNLIWKKPVWMWADQWPGGHNSQKYSRTAYNMIAPSQPEGDVVGFSWNEQGAFIPEMKSVGTNAVAVPLDDVNLSVVIPAIKEQGIELVLLQVWSDYSPGSSRRQWISRLPEVVQQFR